MGIGASILIIAAGAIMTFAVETDSAEGFNINTAGVILMIVGAIGLLVTLVMFGTNERTARTERRTTVYRDEV